MKRNIGLCWGEREQRIPTPCFTSSCQIIYEEGNDILTKGQYVLKTKKMCEPAFNSLVEFLMGNEMEITSETYHGLRDAAKELMCDELSELVSAFAETNLTVADDDVCALYKEIEDLRREHALLVKNHEQMKVELISVRKELEASRRMNEQLQDKYNDLSESVRIIMNQLIETSVSAFDSQIIPSEQVENEIDNVDGLKEDDINICMQQAGVSRAKAIKALKSADGDLVTAVMDLYGDS